MVEEKEVKKTDEIPTENKEDASELSAEELEQAAGGAPIEGIGGEFIAFARQRTWPVRWDKPGPSCSTRRAARTRSRRCR